MKITDLSKALSLPVADLRILLGQMGLNDQASDLDDEIANAMISERNGIKVNSYLEPEQATPASEPQPEKKRGRKSNGNGGKLVKSTADGLTQAVAGANLQCNQVVRVMLQQRMMANVAIADLISRAGEMAFLSRMQQNEQEFASNFVDAQQAQLKDVIEAIDSEVATILTGLGVNSPNESLAKSEIELDKTILEDLATLTPQNWLVYESQ